MLCEGDRFATPGPEVMQKQVWHKVGPRLIIFGATSDFRVMGRCPLKRFEGLTRVAALPGGEDLRWPSNTSL